MKGYLEFSEYYGSQEIKYADEFVKITHHPNLRTDIITVNTAWYSSCGDKDFANDFGNLLVPEAAFEKALQHLVEDNLSILVMHHPLSWLTEFCRSDIENLIDGKIDIHLFGHAHEPRTKHISSYKGNSLVSQSGALYQGRDRPNNYSLISIHHPDKYNRTIFRSYYDSRGEFSSGENICEKGVIYSSKEAKKIWSKLESSIDRESVRNWISSKLLPKASEFFNMGIPLMSRLIGKAF